MMRIKSVAKFYGALQATETARIRVFPRLQEILIYRLRIVMRPEASYKDEMRDVQWEYTSKNRI